jgi:hypothetical protein
LNRPVLIYGSEAWVLTKREENQCGPKIENGVYRSRYSYDHDKEFDSLNVLNVTETRRLRYAGHMIRRPQDPKTYHKVLYSEPNSMKKEIKEDRNPDGRMG